ncbi:hypothetical protein [Plantibacter sp. YIM 135347]|uniref:hypothetical protein n=1 Tax=Plantibacter sp. YIM 135347 TaxID=3423919 RepID=UPI003D335033
MSKTPPAPSVLKEERTALVEALTDTGIQTFDHLPGRFTPPAALVLHGSPYISTETFSDYTVTFSVELIAGQSGDNEVTTDDLDNLILTACVALTRAGYAVSEVGQPGMLTIQGGTFLAVPITTTTTITLTS